MSSSSKTDSVASRLALIEKHLQICHEGDDPDSLYGESNEVYLRTLGLPWPAHPVPHLGECPASVKSALKRSHFLDFVPEKNDSSISEVQGRKELSTQSSVAPEQEFQRRRRKREGLGHSVVNESLDWPAKKRKIEESSSGSSGKVNVVGLSAFVPSTLEEPESSEVATPHSPTKAIAPAETERFQLAWKEEPKSIRDAQFCSGPIDPMAFVAKPVEAVQSADAEDLVPETAQPEVPRPDFGNLFRKAGFDGSEHRLGEEIVPETHSDGRGLGFASGGPKIEEKVHKIDLDASIITDESDKVQFISFEGDQTEWFEEWSFVEGKQKDNRQGARFDFFCDPRYVLRMFEAKDKFSMANARDFVEARNRANPYETLGKHCFMNRAALKIANLDSLFGLGIDTIRRGSTTPVTTELHFADICAGPGGFTQYVFYRRKEGIKRGKGGARGYGFTLKGQDDWKFPMYEMPYRTHFLPAYGQDKSGNILLNKNMLHFARFVHIQAENGRNDDPTDSAQWSWRVEGMERRSTGTGVDLVLADGGISVELMNYQESELKQLVFCQVICALLLLKKDGFFVLKVFDTLTLFTASVIYVLYRCFKKICVVKPASSRPANSERYVVCISLRFAQPKILEYLLKVNSQLGSMKLESERLGEKSDEHPDIVSLFPESVIRDDKVFSDYLRDRNESILRNQLDALDRVFMYLEDQNLQPLLKREKAAQKLIETWRLPPLGSIVGYRPEIIPSLEKPEKPSSHFSRDLEETPSKEEQKEKQKGAHVRLDSKYVMASYVTVPTYKKQAETKQVPIKNERPVVDNKKHYNIKKS